MLINLLDEKIFVTSFLVNPLNEDRGAIKLSLPQTYSDKARFLENMENILYERWRASIEYTVCTCVLHITRGTDFQCVCFKCSPC